MPGRPRRSPHPVRLYRPLSPSGEAWAWNWAAVRSGLPLSGGRVGNTTTSSCLTGPTEAWVGHSAALAAPPDAIVQVFFKAAGNLNRASSRGHRHGEQPSQALNTILGVRGLLVITSGVLREWNCKHRR